MGKTKEQEMDELLAYFKKPETIEKVTAIAIQFNTVFRFEWFTLNQCSTVFKEASLEQLVDIMRSLDLCGFLVTNNKQKDTRYRLSKATFKKMTDAISGYNNKAV